MTTESNVEQRQAVADALHLDVYGQVIWKDVSVPYEQGVSTEDLKDIEYKLLLARGCMVNGGAPAMFVVLRVTE